MKINIIKTVGFYIATIFLLINTYSLHAQTLHKQPTYVLIPGAWHGGWAWQKVAAGLRAKGDIVYTPTLSGLGEHKHTISKQINLDTHIADVINLILMEDLHNVILVGHSYAGTVIAGVADSIPERLSKLVFLDAMIVKDGQSAMTVQTQDTQDAISAIAQKTDWISVPAWPAEGFGVSDPNDAKWVNERLTPHPFGTFNQPLHLRHTFGNNLPLIYVACTNPMLPIIKSITATLAKDKKWKYYTLNTGHDAMIIQPDSVISLLQSFK